MFTGTVDRFDFRRRRLLVNYEVLTGFEDGADVFVTWVRGVAERPSAGLMAVKYSLNEFE